jgi:uncharacterized membrane protein YphA (DoxX/SURF4 family)
MTAFLENTAITGALVLFLVIGLGPWNLDNRKRAAA